MGGKILQQKVLSAGVDDDTQVVLGGILIQGECGFLFPKISKLVVNLPDGKAIQESDET